MEKNRLVIGVVVLLLSYSVSAQEPFKKEGKWGVSEYGSEEDSIIVPAEYDAVEIHYSSVGKNLYTGEKNGEWKVISKNRLLSQQSYEKIVLPDFEDRYAYCYRDEYIDIVDLKEQDFLVRGVQADAIVDGSYQLNTAENVLLIARGKNYGLIDTKEKKLILKAEYESVISNEPFTEELAFLVVKSGINYVLNRSGEVAFEIEVPQNLTKVETVLEIENCYTLYVAGKKGGHGFYDSDNEWLIPPVYMSVEPMEFVSEVIVVKDKKGYGLYFEGKQLLDCKYDSISKSDKRGYLAVVKQKEEEFYLNPEGKLVTLE
ncbi:MAG: WG repeat-containing protein [Crocinitomicaceae bacterium]